MPTERVILAICAILNCIGMTFDFTVVSITMENCVSDILAECGVTAARATPAAATHVQDKEERQQH